MLRYCKSFVGDGGGETVNFGQRYEHAACTRNCANGRAPRGEPNKQVTRVNSMEFIIISFRRNMHTATVLQQRATDTKRTVCPCVRASVWTKWHNEITYKWFNWNARCVLSTGSAPASAAQRTEDTRSWTTVACDQRAIIDNLYVCMRFHMQARARTHVRKSVNIMRKYAPHTG